jgi:hypothetical protein
MNKPTTTISTMKVNNVKKYAQELIAVGLLLIYFVWIFSVPSPINMLPVIFAGGWFIGARTYHVSVWLNQYFQAKGYY